MENIILTIALFPRFILSTSLMMAAAGSFGAWRFALVRPIGGRFVSLWFERVFLALFCICVVAVVVLLSLQFSQLVRPEYLNLFAG